MGDSLPVPPELQHLIEKRENEADRRQDEQRTADNRRQLDLGPLGAIESAETLDDVPESDRRATQGRRKRRERRRKRRRRSDQ